MDELARFRLRPVESYSDVELEQLSAMGTRLRRDGRLSPSTRLVGAEICRRLNSPTRDGTAFASNELLAECLHLSINTVASAVEALEEAGYFTIVAVGSANRFEVRQPLIGEGEG